MQCAIETPWQRSTPSPWKIIWRPLREVLETVTRGILWKKLSLRFLKLHRKAPVPVSFLIKLQAWGLQFYLKKDSSTGFFLLILRTSANDCLCSKLLPNHAEWTWRIRDEKLIVWLIRRVQVSEMQWAGFELVLNLILGIHENSAHKKSLFSSF